MGELFFFSLPNSASHHNNHLTAPCGLAAASDVEGERGGGSSCDWTVTNPIHCDTGQRSTLMDLPPLLPVLP